MILRTGILFILVMFVGYCSNGQTIRDSVIVKNHPRSEFADVLSKCDNILHFTNEKIVDGDATPKFEIGFFKQTLKNKSFYRFAAFRCCNFTTGDKGAQHLAISEFIYNDKIHAQRAFKYLKSIGKNSLSELLMEFHPLRIKTSVFIILSETLDDPDIQKVMTYFSDH